MAQEEGLIGKLVGGMVRRSVRARFRAVYWTPPVALPPTPMILAANHHGWHDGYLMFCLITRLGVRCVDWIAEYEAFPLFRKIGGMPFPPSDPALRAATIRRTVRLMRSEKRSLVIFPEAELHRGPEVRPFGRAVESVAVRTQSPVVPVAIAYDMSLHERPEAYLRLGAPLTPGGGVAAQAQSAVATLLDELRCDITNGHSFDVLVKGTGDVNERWDLRRTRSGGQNSPADR